MLRSGDLTSEHLNELVSWDHSPYDSHERRRFHDEYDLDGERYDYDIRTKIWICRGCDWQCQGEDYLNGTISVSSLQLLERGPNINEGVGITN